MKAGEPPCIAYLPVSVRINQEYSCVIGFPNMGSLNIDSYCCSFVKRHLRSLIESVSLHYIRTHSHTIRYQNVFTIWRDALNFERSCIFLRDVASSRRKTLSRFLSHSLSPDGPFTYFYLNTDTHTYTHFLLPVTIIFSDNLTFREKLICLFWLPLERKIVSFSDNILIFIWISSYNICKSFHFQPDTYLFMCEFSSLQAHRANRY